MNSPLPDSSALEAGIIEDERPTRLSRVQDNVRNLLRTSVFGSVKSSPATTPTRSRHEIVHGLPTPVSSPIRIQAQPVVLPSPSTSGTTPASVNVGDFPQPLDSYHARVQRMAHQSALFNTRAVAALNHPDLSDPSMEELDQQKNQHRQRKAWKRSRRSKKAAQRATASRCFLCLLASFLLAALVATYISIATTIPNLSTTFHILFVLGICLATILAAHSVLRLLFMGRRNHNQPLFVTVSRHGHQHRPRRRNHPYRQHQERQMPSLSGEPTAFVPPLPIPVHLSSDDIREDPNIAQPSAGARRASQAWDKDVSGLPNPPPAYGRWRGSVRANPELLHWQAIPSPVSPETPVLPSPTYEEAMAIAQNESPPSYVTRNSPAREREVQEMRDGVAHCQVAEPEPEMIEVRPVGVGLAM